MTAAEWDVKDELLSRALDEIYRLRRALAYEALGVKAHTSYKTFPKTRRPIADEQVARMQRAACGECELVYAGTSWMSLRGALREAGAGETFTMADWRRECHVDSVSDTMNAQVRGNARATIGVPQLSGAGVREHPAPGSDRQGVQAMNEVTADVERVR